MAFAEALKGQCPTTEIVFIRSPEGDPAANGLAERAVGLTKEYFKTLQLELEENFGAAVPETHPIWSWVARHATNSVSRYRVLADVRTSYQRVHGRPFKRQTACFRECVSFVPVLRQKDGYRTEKGYFRGSPRAHWRGPALIPRRCKAWNPSDSESHRHKIR